jgi:pimeloyl-ACP methyl ester carboxylesterase
MQYSKMGEKGLPVLLIHGFGASWEHYRDNIKSLAAEGNNVWALSLLGFGRSEKPDVVYTQDLWAELIRDFIVEVVGEPVVLVGNSIGGISCS